MTLTTTGTSRQIYDRVAGDTGPPVELTLEGGPDLLDMNLNTSEVWIWRRRATRVVLPGSAIDVLDFDTKQLAIDIELFLSTVTWAGDWKITVHGVLDDGGEWTWPWDVIRVGVIP